MNRDAAESTSIDVLLFDLGGVVIDIDFGRCFARWADSARCDPDEIRGRFAADAAYADHERGVLDAAAYFGSLRELLDIDVCDEDLLRGWNDIYVGLVPGVAELLAVARGRFPLYAFTNTNPSHTAVWSTRFRRELDVFTETFVSSDLGVRKPDREAFEAVATAIGVPEGRILFFDDSEENVEGARAAGLQAVHVTSPCVLRSSLRLVGIELAVEPSEERLGKYEGVGPWSGQAVSMAAEN